jgi:hypothetical protein
MILVSELFPRLHTLHTRWGGRRVSHSTFSSDALPIGWARGEHSQQAAAKQKARFVSMFGKVSIVCVHLVADLLGEPLRRLSIVWRSTSH